MELLEKICHLYDVRLGQMKLDDYNLSKLSDYKLVHAKPYPILFIQENASKAETNTGN